MRRADDIAPSLNALKSKDDGLYVCIDTRRLMESRVELQTLHTRALADMFRNREYMEASQSYAANFSILHRRAAEYVDTDPRGAKPNDIPVEQPTKFDLIINLTTAKALGLKVPPALLASADEVIE